VISSSLFVDNDHVRHDADMSLLLCHVNSSAWEYCILQKS